MKPLEERSTCANRSSVPSDPPPRAQGTGHTRPSEVTSESRQAKSMWLLQHHRDLSSRQNTESKEFAGITDTCPVDTLWKRLGYECLRCLNVLFLFVLRLLEMKTQLKFGATNLRPPPQS